MSGQLQGKCVLVTGGDSTLGRAAVQRLTSEGAQVETVAAEAGAVLAAAQRLGGLYALVNFVPDDLQWKPFVDKTDADFATIFVRLRGVTGAMRAAYPLLKASHGRVVNVGSIYGSTSYAHVSDRVMADWALQGITRAVAVEWAPDPVLVNYIQPGALDIPELKTWRQGRERAVDHRIEGLAFGRLGDPVEHFGGALMFLLSDEACYIVGHPVYADGGQHLVAPIFEPGSNP